VFRRPAHRDVAKLLAALDAEALAGCDFWFGGGTRIVLDLDEFRESQDVDFLCATAAGYSAMRQRVGARGFAALFRADGRAGLEFPREIRMDQYGIRFPVKLGGASLKVELIREARIAFGLPVRPPWSPVDCLSLDDCYAEKLLANSDRWADRQFLSRDLSDLAALRVLRGPIPAAAWQKTQTAYGGAPATDLHKSLVAFEGDLEHQRRCFAGLRIEDPALIPQGLALLRDDLATPST
jgi:Nucleotidyl transferase AbiEii toxin, Type IV TA system